jgi:dTMP kinase
MERAPDAFFQRIREGYLHLAAEEPHRFAVLDAGLDPDTVTSHLLSAVRQRCHGLLP